MSRKRKNEAREPIELDPEQSGLLLQKVRLLFAIFSQGKPNVALSFLSKALVESDKYGVADGLEHACTLLNICAILSGLSKYVYPQYPIDTATP